MHRGPVGLGPIARHRDDGCRRRNVTGGGDGWLAGRRRGSPAGLRHSGAAALEG